MIREKWGVAVRKWGCDVRHALQLLQTIYKSASNVPVTHISHRMQTASHLTMVARFPEKTRFTRTFAAAKTIAPNSVRGSVMFPCL